MPPQGHAGAEPASPPRPRGRVALKASKTMSQKELSVVVMLLAAETAVVASSQDTTVAQQEQPHPGAGAPWMDRLTVLYPQAARVDATVAAMARVAIFPDNVGDGLNAATRRAVCAYLPWRDCFALRQTCKSWKTATLETVMVASLPSKPDQPALFLPAPREIEADHTTEAALRCKHPSKWRCLFCGFCNSETRILCGNRACQVPCASHRDCARLFLGQLRREATVPFLRWLVEGVMASPANPACIVNAENHRHLATGRGKGCAWIYLECATMASAVLNFHHRVFADVESTTGREGVWIVDHGAELQLAADVERRATYDPHRSLVLPRCPLVVEYPCRQPYPALPAAPTSAMQQPNPYNAPPPPTYQTTMGHMAASPTGGSMTPVESQWLPSTDSPPSELSDETKVTSAPRRHEPYRTPVVGPQAGPAPAALETSASLEQQQHHAAAYYQWAAYPGYSNAMYAQAPRSTRRHRAQGRRGYHNAHGGYGMCDYPVEAYYAPYEYPTDAYGMPMADAQYYTHHEMPVTA
jgi:hypothetical protein